MKPDIKELQNLVTSVREAFERRGTEHSTVMACLLRVLLDLMHHTQTPVSSAADLLSTALVKFIEENE